MNEKEIELRLKLRHLWNKKGKGEVGWEEVERIIDEVLG